MVRRLAPHRPVSRPAASWVYADVPDASVRDVICPSALYLNDDAMARLGYSEREITEVSDRLVDGIVGHGDAAAIAAKVGEHLAAGADHVMVMVTGTDFADGVEQLEQLGPTLAGLADSGAR